mgnify:CR=1 FL=1
MISINEFKWYNNDKEVDIKDVDNLDKDKVYSFRSNDGLLKADVYIPHSYATRSTEFTVSVGCGESKHDMYVIYPFYNSRGLHIDPSFSNIRDALDLAE